MARPPARAEAVADAITAKIESGDLIAGAWLPPERELSEAHLVVRSTVRRAVDILIARGLVVRESGSGVRVRPPRPRRDSLDITERHGQWRGFHVSMARQGQQPYTETVVREDVPADPVVARWLGVPVGTPVLERARRQGVRGEPPKQLSTTWLIPEIAERLPVLRQHDTGPGGTHSRMEEIGYVLSFEDTVTCRRALPHECERLEVAAGDPVLTIWRRCYDQSDRVVEVTFRVIPGDRLEQIYRYASHG
jgi:GntR family transcriptional regulator